jgi:hypothetical protein
MRKERRYDRAGPDPRSGGPTPEEHQTGGTVTNALTRTLNLEPLYAQIRAKHCGASTRLSIELNTGSCFLTPSLRLPRTLRAALCR